jgi:hypothetical protein
MLLPFWRFMKTGIAHRAAQANLLFAKTVSSNMEVSFTYSASFFRAFAKV